MKGATTTVSSCDELVPVQLAHTLEKDANALLPASPASSSFSDLAMAAAGSEALPPNGRPATSITMFTTRRDARLPLVCCWRTLMHAAESYGEEVRTRPVNG